jgi:hypothetical protein
MWFELGTRDRRHVGLPIMSDILDSHEGNRGVLELSGAMLVSAWRTKRRNGELLLPGFGAYWY